ncbi:HD domain-containing protein [Shouchella sp. JSM 1781072]|uniref:HD domain-containing protein n=1 Tax=Bacillaceae TaxID=186817 RepID=UPI000C081AF8|nr:HD domain-containing protein [Bacillus sp. Marseille-P3800]
MLLIEPLYPNVQMFNWERALFQTRKIKRLKQLAHYGAGSFVSPVTHSRFEHTLGVWKLTAMFFREREDLRAAAILHDIGHLPFSHAVERTLGYNHHHLTEISIRTEEDITSILSQNGISVEKVIQCLNEENGLLGTTDGMGLDHLDSFLRDTYMLGGIEGLPKDLLPHIRWTSQGIEADADTCAFIMDCVVNDHALFLSPLLLAVDRVLAEAVRLHLQDNPSPIESMTDDELLAELKASNQKEVQELMEVLLYRTDRLHVSESVRGEGLEVNVRKLYHKAPLYNGKSYSETAAGMKQMNRLNGLKKTYNVTVV